MFSPGPDPSAGQPTLIVSPLGDLAPWIPALLAQRLPEIFGLPVQVMPLLADLKFAFDPGRNQYHSTAVLGRLASACPDHGLKILGVATVDLFIPILTHVYGEAQLGGRAAVVSVYRLLGDLPGPGRGEERLIKEAVHELGHCFDLRHCPDPACIMHYCRKISDVDHKAMQLCRYCRILLRDRLIEAGPVSPAR